MRILLCLFLFNLALSGQENLALFDKANIEYADGKYAEAVKSYQQVVSNGFHSSELYYNLANAAYKNGELGVSILYYEKANLLSPDDKRINQNLTIARDKVDSEIIEIPDFALLRWWRAFSKTFSPVIWIALQCLCLLLLAYGVFLWRSKDVVGLRKRGLAMMAGGLLLFSIFLFAGRTSHDLLHESQSAIILDDTVLKTAPDHRSDDNLELSEGVKVKIIDSIDDWYKVQLVNKELGWISAEVIGLI